jgi:hypothetical protein
MNKLILAVIIIIIIIIIVAVAVSMNMLPEGLKEGDVVACHGSPAIFKIENGKKRFYSWNAYAAAGQPVPKRISCAGLDRVPKGADM